MSGQEKHLYEFGPFRLDPARRRLLRDGEPVPLTPKAFETLLALVQQSGRTVEKDDLMRRVWPGAVVEENNLNQNITALRRCLGDSRQASQYIATIPGLGYRFVAEVRTAPFAEAVPPSDVPGPTPAVAEEDAAPGEDARVVQASQAAGGAESAKAPASAAEEGGFSGKIEALPPPAPGESAAAAPKPRWWVAAAVAALLLVGATAALALWAYRKADGADTAGAAAGEVEVTALTRTGTTGRAVISPDGRHIIYSVAEAGRESLWLRQAAASSAQQIVAPAKVEYLGLTFSRDGNHLYFVRAESNGSQRALHRLPALGGVPTKLLDDVHSPVTLSPDGGRLAFVRNTGGVSALVVANAEGGEQFRLAERPPTDPFKVPAWSPDGNVIACSTGSRDRYDFHNGVVAVRAEDGEQSPVSPRRWGWTGWVEWLADGSGLLITASEHPEGMDQVWHIAHPGGAARRVTSDSKRYRTISLTSDSRTLVAVQTELNSEIWVAPEADAGRAQKITFGTGAYLDVCYTPDGRIVYASQAGGGWDIWVMNADGSGQRQLTADAGVNAHPTVSPDGRRIAGFHRDASAGNGYRIVVLPSGGGPPEQTFAVPQDIVPLPFVRWSPDGQALTYTAHRDGIPNIWAQPLGGGPARQLTDFKVEGRLRFDWSRDGRQLVWSRHVWAADLVLLRNFNPGKV